MNASGANRTLLPKVSNRRSAGRLPAAAQAVLIASSIGVGPQTYIIATVRHARDQLDDVYAGVLVVDAQVHAVAVVWVSSSRNAIRMQVRAP